MQRIFPILSRGFQRGFNSEQLACIGYYMDKLDLMHHGFQTNIQPYPWSLQQKQGISMTQVETGMIIRWKGDFYRIVRAQVSAQGRQRPIVAAELKELRSGRRISHTFRGAEEVQQIPSLEKKDFEVQYVAGDQVYLVDKETDETQELDISEFGSYGEWLMPGITISIGYYEEEIVTMQLPQKVKSKVLATHPHSEMGWQYGTLENGQKIKMPDSVKKGEEVVVDPSYGQFVEVVA